MIVIGLFFSEFFIFIEASVEINFIINIENSESHLTNPIIVVHTAIVYVGLIVTTKVSYNLKPFFRVYVHNI